MIAYVRGILSSILEESVIVDVEGVGYEVICANPYSFQSELKENILLHTYYHVRDDAHLLYGFKTEDEKYLFTKLISVSGIGPKSAIAILGSIDIESFVSAIEREDDKFLMSFPGVGKKTARQIILDLKGKLSFNFTITENQEQSKSTNPVVDELTDVKEALKALGFVEKEIRSILPELQKQEDKSTDALIRIALTLLTKN